MKGLKVPLLACIVVLISAGAPYFITMLTTGQTSISSNNQDWSAFGSYIGGIISPAASLLAAYLVYKSFALSAHQQNLILARDSITRLDLEIERKLVASFNNNCLGDQFLGLSFRKIIIALSNEEVRPHSETDKTILFLLHNIAITINSVRYYIELLKKSQPPKVTVTGWAILNKAIGSKNTQQCVHA